MHKIEVHREAYRTTTKGELQEYFLKVGRITIIWHSIRYTLLGVL